MNVDTWLITPAESERDQRRAAGGLAVRGLGPGDRVALALPNSPAFLATVLGAMRTGIVPVPLNPSLTAAELDAIIADAEPQLVIRSPSELASLMASGAWPRADLADVPLCRPMHYTSGTSGRPKGVWPGMLSESDARLMHLEEAEVWQLGPDDTHLTCSPLYHSVAIRFSAQALLRGASLVLLSRFDASVAAGAISEFDVRSTFMVPTHLQRLLSLPSLRSPASLASLAAIRRLVHAGAACPLPLKQRLFETFPSSSVWEFYGATEGQFTVCSPSDWLAHPGSVGRARPGRRLSIDPDGQIWCAVPSFARWSYWGDPVKTASAWRGSSFTVGDLGRLDESGFLYLDGRRDDLIISGGVNVYPAEVEQALVDLAGIDEVAVFGVADDRWGQRVCAAVVGTVTPAAVVSHARTVLAGYKCPKDVYIVDDLPRTGTGKVRRSQIATWLGLPSDP